MIRTRLTVKLAQTSVKSQFPVIFHTHKHTHTQIIKIMDKRVKLIVHFNIYILILETRFDAQFALLQVHSANIRDIGKKSFRYIEQFFFQTYPDNVEIYRNLVISSSALFRTKYCITFHCWTRFFVENVVASVSLVPKICHRCNVAITKVERFSYGLILTTKFINNWMVVAVAK